MLCLKNVPFVFVAACFPTSVIHAQITLDWSVTHGTAAADQISCLTTDSAGNVYAAGVWNGGYAFHKCEAFVSAFGPTGTVSWTNTFDGAAGGLDYPFGLASDGTGGVYVAGMTAIWSQARWGSFLWRVDANGSTVWSVELGPADNVWPGVAFVMDGQGRPILGGATADGSGDLSVRAYTSGGTLDWEVIYAGSSNDDDLITAIGLAPNGDIIAAGWVGGFYLSRVGLLRIAPDGSLVYAFEFADPGIERTYVRDLAIDAQGNVFIVGDNRLPGANLSSLWLAAFDPSGAHLWSRQIPGNPYPELPTASGYDVELDSHGRVLVAGTRNGGFKGQDLLVAAYDKLGNQEWLRTVAEIPGPILSTPNFSPKRLFKLVNGEMVVVGSYGIASTNLADDAFAISFDSLGESRFAITYGFPPTKAGSFDFALAGVSTENGFLMAGSVQVGVSDTDAFIARWTRTANAFCLGDGSSGACPCGNESSSVESAGCMTSLGRGARLADLGESSLANDTLSLRGASMPNSSTLYFQGTSAVAAVAFGDGLRCVGGSLVRLGTATNRGGTSQYPGVGDPSVSVRGLVNLPGERVYQVWFRNAVSFCTSAAYNLTNGLRVSWTL
jgi:hypothetical protein